MQSKRMSLVETITNQATGFFISWLLNLFVFPKLFGYHLSGSQSFVTTLLFTGISIVRSYVVRRTFNKIK